jgi:plasmid stability protein
VRQLRSRAAAEGVSVEEAHRRVLRQALLGEPAPARKNFIEYLRAMPDVDLPLTRARDRPRKVAL